MKQSDPLLDELMDAAVHDPERARQLVLSQPHVLDLRTSLGETALHYLAIENYADAVQLLIDLGAKVNVINEFGNTAIEEAEAVEATNAVMVLRRAIGELKPLHTGEAETDLATAIECDHYGRSSTTFVCQHLARGTGLGFFTSAEDTSDPRPYAWCSACEDLVNAAGGWDEETEALAGITLLCDRCYDVVKGRNTIGDEQ